MLIGHLPAGYFLSRYLIKRNKLPLNKLWLGLGLLAAILPDFDIAYSILFTDSMASHRLFYTNFPLLYLTVLLIFIIIYYIRPSKNFKFGIIIVFANIFLHFILDTAFVGIKWLWPFYDRLIGVYNVNITEGIRVENYFNHWYWYLEIALWILAIISVIISFKKGELENK